MEQSGPKQSKFDPCLFVGEKVTYIVYVDDLMFWYRNKDDIHNLEMHLHGLGVDLEQEDDIAGFLVVTLGREIKTGLIEMKQNILIKPVIEAVGLDNGMLKGKFTSLKQITLVKDTNGEPQSGVFSYSSVVGMIIYLSGHTSSDTSFPVKCCTQYMFSTKRYHDLELKRLARYLKNTQYRGLVLDPNYDIFKVDAYPDDDFS